MLRKPRSYENRSVDQLTQHYEVEKELAGRLRNATKSQRAAMYAEVYDELFCRVPDHPQLTRPLNTAYAEEVVDGKMRLLKTWLQPDTVFLELGAGDCQLALRAASSVRTAYALDVSRQITRDVRPPDNFELVISSGTDIPIAPDTATVAYSYQLMEHIHPDDALEQLQNIYRVLMTGGVYICVTPNRLSGPHDISRYFDRFAVGFHMREYTLTEVAELFRSVGFRKVFVCVSVKGVCLKLPIWMVSLVERGINALPWKCWPYMTDLPGVRQLISAAVAGRK